MKPKRLAFVLIALAALAESGCAALGLPPPCGPCGWFSRIWPHRAAADCCAPGVGGVPALEVAPGAVAVPGAVVPAPPGAIQQLEPAPSATPVEPGASSRGGSPGKTNYEASRGGSRGLARGANLARALGPGQAARRSAPRVAAANNPLDNLPPLTLPTEAQPAASPPSAPASQALPQPASELPGAPRTNPAPGAAPAAAAPAAAAEPVVPTAATTTAADTPKGPANAEALPPPAEAEALSVTPGIKHFQGLEPSLAGGSLPTTAGLDWLAEKGYKTLIDLREPGADEAAFITEVTRRGLRYLPLPVSLKTFDAEHVNRFNAELDQADARPLYFFDAEGDRAGALWYIRRITVEKVKADPKTAVQEARALGLSDHHIWLAATAYLDRALKPAAAAGSEPAAATGAEAASLPSEPAAIEPPKMPVPEAARPAPAAASAERVPAASEPLPRDPAAWRPLAALVVTALSVPLAYWAPSAVMYPFRARASLPAPARQVRSLPAASGAET